MNITYIIHKVAKEGGFSLAITLKNNEGVISADKRHLLSPQDKMIAEHLIKDFNASKPLKASSLEYGKFDKVPVSEKQLNFFLLELAKVRDVQFEGKKVIIDGLSQAKLHYEIHLNDHQMTIEPSIIDGLKKYPLDDIESYFGDKSIWLLHKGVLKKLKQEGKWLKLGFEKPVLTSKKKDDVLDHYENQLPLDSTVPEATFKKAKQELISPFPILQLKNQRGLFFDLFFDYSPHGFFSLNDPKNAFYHAGDETFWESLMLKSGVKKSGREYFVSALDQERIFRHLIDEGFCVKSTSGKKVVLVSESKGTIYDDHEQTFAKIHIQFEAHDAPLDSLKAAILEKSPFVALDESYIGLMPLSMLDDLGPLATCPALGNQFRIDSFKRGDFSFKSIKMEDRTILDFKDLKFDLFDLKLLDFQKKGVFWLLSLFQKRESCLLADDMGLGKTIQVLAFIDLVKAHLKKGVLIVCPKSIKTQWEKAIDSHLKGIDILCDVMTFHQLRSQEHMKAYSCVVIDEAQAIKNSKTLAYEKSCAIDSDFRLCLTGTPIENSLNDLVSLFGFLNPLLTQDFAGMNANLNLQKILRRLNPFILRRTKKEVLKDLPMLFEQMIEVEMTPTQHQMYQGFIQKAKNEPIHPFALLTSLRMTALDARLIDPDCDDQSHKTWQIIEDINQIVDSSQKVIVFSQFTSYLSILKGHLEERGIGYSYLDGQTMHRDKVIESFSQEVSVLLMSLKAGGVGLNLQMADYVLLADPWWNQASENQAIDRAYRLGRTTPVVARRYVTLNSLEMKIQELKASKWALMEDLQAMTPPPLSELLDMILD